MGTVSWVRGGSQQSRITGLQLNAGVTYYIVLGVYVSAGGGSATLTITQASTSTPIPTQVSKLRGWGLREAQRGHGGMVWCMAPASKGGASGRLLAARSGRGRAPTQVPACLKGLSVRGGESLVMRRLA